jgi:hypothetical protein
VVWKVPFTIDRAKPAQAAATAISGYGDWDGETGTIHAPDSTISDSPGSGAGRLLSFGPPQRRRGAPLEGRVHVSTEVPLGPEACAMLPPDNGLVSGLKVLDVTDRDARVEFMEAQDRGKPVEQYEIRYLVGRLDDPRAVPAGDPRPGDLARHARLDGLGEAARAQAQPHVHRRGAGAGGCVKEGPLAQASFTTVAPVYKQLSGCFVATAAYGSALEPQVAALRQARDVAREKSGFAAVSVGLYERASPPLAGVLRETEVGRALVRAALSPIVSAVDGASRVSSVLSRSE